MKKKKFFFLVLFAGLIVSGGCVHSSRDTTSQNASSLQPLHGTVSKNAKIREAPSLKAKALKSLPAGTVITIENANSEWYEILQDGHKGYIFHTLVDLPNKPSLLPEEKFNEEKPFRVMSAAKIRSGPGQDYAPPLDVAAAGVQFKTDGRTGSWYHGTTGSTTGWIHETLLQEEGNSDQASQHRAAAGDHQVQTSSLGAQDGGSVVMGATQAGGHVMKGMGQATSNVAEAMPKGSAAHDAVKLGGDAYSEMGSAAASAASEESKNSEGGAITSLGEICGRMMNVGGQAANRAADSMPKDSTLHDAAKLTGAYYSNRGAAIEKAANEESKNPQGGGVMSIAKMYGEGASAGGQALSRSANELSDDSALKGVGKVSGAAFTGMGSSIQKTAAQESSNPQGGGVGSLVKVTGSAMKGGGDAASNAANELPQDSAVRGVSKVGGAAYSHAGSAVESALDGKAHSSEKPAPALQEPAQAQPPTPKPQQFAEGHTAAGGKTCVTIASTVKVRENPSSFARVLQEAAPGSTVTVLEQQSGWYKIRIGSTVGYMQTNELAMKE